MSSRAQELLREALALPLDERADVAAELLASLDDAEAEDPAEVLAAWAAENRAASAPRAGRGDDLEHVVTPPRFLAQAGNVAGPDGQYPLSARPERTIRACASEHALVRFAMNASRGDRPSARNPANRGHTTRQF